MPACSLGKFYRADELTYLSATNQKKLTELGVRRVVVFRSEAEHQKAGDKLPTGIEINSTKPWPLSMAR